MKFKDNVTITFNPTINHIIQCADRAHLEVIGREAFCTSGSEGTHSLNSGHYYNRCLDVRHGLHFKDPYMTVEQAEKIRAFSEEYLNADDHAHGVYIVLIKPNHIHYQRQKDSF